MKRIILLRHGQVDINIFPMNKQKIKYDDLDIKNNFSSKNEMKDILNSKNIIICSKLKRSLQSVELFNEVPYQIDSIFNEVKFIFDNLYFLRLNTVSMSILFKILHKLKLFENEKDRVKQATLLLEEMTKKNKTIVLVGHYIINNLIKEELLFLNYKETKKLKHNNWDYGIFEYNR